MMKGKGGAAGVGASSWTDADPFKDRKGVSVSVKNLKFDRDSMTLSFSIANIGFTKSQSKINFAFEVNKDKEGNSTHWKYYTFTRTVNFTNPSQSLSLKNDIRSNSDLYSILTFKYPNGKYAVQTGNLYVIFYNETEIVKDQIKVTIT